MSDELMLQYERLEQKVAERTQELEISKVRNFGAPLILVYTELCVVSPLTSCTESSRGRQREQDFIHCEYIP
jgi:hypothetical protein